MLQTNVREGYRITTLEVVKLIEDLISYLAVAKCTRLRNAQILKVFYEAASLSVVSNRSIALITNKFSVALLTKPAILNDANVALVDAVHYSVVIDALTITLIKDNDDLLGTVNSYIKLRRLRAHELLKLKYTLLISICNGPPLKRYKTKAADSRHAKASRRRTKKDKDLEDSNTSSDLGKKAQLKKTRDEEELAKRKTQLDSLLDSDDYCLDSSLDINSKNNLEDEEATTAKDLLIDAYILYFKELSSNNSGIFANAIGIGKTRAIVLATEVQNAQAEGDAIEHNAVNDDDKLCPTKGERTFYCADPLALQFCFFSNSLLENIGRLTKEEAIKMRINTTNAISKALAAANKLVALRSYTILEANTPAVHSKATKHRLALLVAQFVIVCSFRKVDKHMFRAYNTISVTAQRTIIRKGGPYIEKRAILLPTLNSLAIAKQWRNIIANVKHDASEHKSSYNIKSDFLPYFQSCLYLDFLSTVQNAKQQCRDILEKEGLNELEASRRVIFNCFEMQAIASYSALATLKAAQFKTYSSCKVKRFTSNSVKDLFTNLSKDYFLVREARAITKSSPKFQNLSNLCSKSIAAEDAAKAANTPLPPKEVCAKILIESYKPIVQALAEMCVSIVYFNLDSELELKVLSKQDVKTTS
ncbi:hypothetical protein HBI29_039690 [Parastagonospora nodorum]|nr:hypothetical protein HBI29_039690 [Parastagonospora nodorum]